jgi:zinc transport system substrate-binding protein
LLIHARSRVRPRRAWLAGLGALCIGLGLTACGSTPSADPPTITVVTGLWPLAQAAAAIGGSSVQVTDVVPAGANPMTWRPDPTERRTIQKADVVLEVGGGFQPGFERAAKGNANTTYLSGPLEVNNPYLWLSPARMVRVARLVYQALGMANPNAESTYADALATFTTNLQQIRSNYATVFSRCTAPLMVAEDDTFDVLRPTFALNFRVLDPSTKSWPSATSGATTPGAATLASQLTLVRRTKVPAVFTETWAQTSYLDPLVKQTGVKVLTLDSLAGVPTGRSAPASYLDGLSDNLKLINAGMRC